MLDRSHKTFLILILATALFFRLLHFRLGEIFITGDETMVTLAGLDFSYVFADFSVYNIALHSLRLLSFGWGYLHILFISLTLMLSSIFNLHITEFIVMLPMVIVGTLSCIVLYALTYEIYENRLIAFIAGMFIAITPIFVSISRTINNAVITSLLLMLALLFFIKYVKTKKYAYLAAISLGLYLGVDNQFFGIFPILFFIFFNYTDVPSFSSFFEIFNAKFISITTLFFIPAALPFFYFLTKGQTEGGIIGHTLNKSKTLGFHPEVAQYYVYAIGISLSLLFLISIFYGLWITIKRKKENFLFIWVLVYSLPWLILVTPQSDSRPYLVHSIIPVFILGAKILYDTFYNKKLILVGILILIFGMTLNTTIYTVHNIKFVEPIMKDKDLVKDVLHFYGSSLQKNLGFKTAGYWIRTNTHENDTIFSEIGFHVSKYYFNRPILANQNVSFSLSSPSIQTKYEFFKNNQDDVNYVVTLAENEEITKEYLKDFNKVVEIQEAGESRLFIYQKGNKSTTQLVILDTTVYDTRFNQEYGTIENLRTPCYFCYE